MRGFLDRVVRCWSQVPSRKWTRWNLEKEPPSASSPSFPPMRFLGVCFNCSTKKQWCIFASTTNTTTIRVPDTDSQHVRSIRYPTDRTRRLLQISHRHQAIPLRSRHRCNRNSQFTRQILADSLPGSASRLNEKTTGRYKRLSHSADGGGQEKHSRRQCHKVQKQRRT